LTPAQKIGTNPSLVAASSDLASTRAGSLRPSTCRSVNSGPAFSSSPKQPVTSISVATTTTETRIPLCTSLTLWWRRLGRLLEPASRHLAPLVPSAQQVDEAAAPEIDVDLVEHPGVQALLDRLGAVHSH
jgi:hypothetical protein